MRKGAVGNRFDRIRRKVEIQIVQSKGCAELLYNRVFRFGKNAHQIVFCQLFKGDVDREAADKFGNKTEFYQIVRIGLVQKLAALFVGKCVHIGAEAHRVLVNARFNDFFEPYKGAAADKQNVRRVDIDEFLIRVLASPLRRNACVCAFDNL